MRGITRNLTRRAGTTPVVRQAFGGDTQVTTQGVVTTQIQLLVEERALQLSIQLAVQLLTRDKELGAIQMPSQNSMSDEKAYCKKFLEHEHVRIG